MQNFTLSCAALSPLKMLYLGFTSAHGISKKGWDIANLMNYYCGDGSQCVMVTSFYSSTQSLVSVGGGGEREVGC